VPELREDTAPQDYTETMITLLRRPALILGLSFLPLALASCGALDALRCESGYTRPDYGALRSDLAAARQRWQTANIRDYRYQFSQFAAPVGFPAITITVLSGKVSRVDKADNQPGEISTDAGKTIDERFGDIERSITQQQGTNCATMQVTYDAVDGHPKQASFGSAERGLADGFGTWTISSFAPLVIN
jgi:Family of unknown function (DUF6174)